MSGYPEMESRLSGLRAGFGGDEGLPQGAQSSSMDPAGLVASISLVDKARKAMARGHIEGARRIVERLAVEHSDAPAVETLRQELQEIQ
tara:strand:+ start:89 stop:355 length:267 start_codon:yes stop_codon:yes gene_type:complete